MITDGTAALHLLRTQILFYQNELQRNLTDILRSSLLPKITNILFHMSERCIGNCTLSFYYAFIKFSLGLEVELKLVSVFYMCYHLMRIVDTENKPMTTSRSIHLFLLSYYNFDLGLHQSTSYEFLIEYRNGILTLLVTISLRESTLD